MADDDKGQGGNPQDGGAGGGKRDDAAFYQEEAKKAFEARDKVKHELRKLQESGRILTDEQVERYKALEDAAAKAEEDRAKKAGEFDTLKNQLLTRHQQEIDEREKKLSGLSERFKRTVVKAEFGAAGEYFSGADTSKTILDVELGMAALGKYVVVEDTDDEFGYRVVVKNPRGETIVGKDGNPAPFSVAIGELIQQLPNRDRILRGSGKTGSGSSGGVGVTSKDMDLSELTRRVQAGDKKAIEAMKQRQADQGQMTIGRRPRIA